MIRCALTCSVGEEGLFSWPQPVATSASVDALLTTTAASFGSPVAYDFGGIVGRKAEIRMLAPTLDPALDPSSANTQQEGDP